MASRLKIEERKVWISKSVTGLFGVLNSDAHVQYAWFLKQFLQKAKLRTLDNKIWEVDPLRCPTCHHDMHMVSQINDAQIIERILGVTWDRGDMGQAQSIPTKGC